MKYKTVLIQVPCGNAKELTDVQQKINQWTTIGLLVKFETFASSTHWLFQVLLKKEGE